MSSPDQAIPIRVAKLEVQVERFRSDLESEKGTRARVNSDLYDKMDELGSEFRAGQKETNHVVYRMVGGLIALQVVMGVVLAMWAKGP